MKKTALIYLFASLFLAVPLTAQTADDAASDVEGTNTDSDDTDNGEDEEESKAEESDAHRRFWQASVPGGHYMVAIDRIASISMHQYVLDAQLLADALETRIPRLIIVMKGVVGTAQFEIKIDGRTVSNEDAREPIAVDPGKHEVSVTVAGSAASSTSG